MEKFKNFLEKNWADVVSVILLTLYFVITIFLKQNLYVSFIDNGREYYTPMLILQGKLLYRDVFMMHPPLSYQINAMMFAVFGANFTTILSFAIVTGYITLMTLYTIARQFVRPLFSFSAVFFIFTAMYYYNYHVMNHIHPYSYGMTYALAVFFLSVVLIIKYLKSFDEGSEPVGNKKKLFLIHGASFLLGITFALKLEFSILYLAMLVLLIIKKENIKTLLVNVLFYSIVPVLSWGVLFMQGLTFDDVLSFLEYLRALVKTKCWYAFTFGNVEWSIRHNVFDRFSSVISALSYLLPYFIVMTILLREVFKKFDKIRFFYLLVLIFIIGMTLYNQYQIIKLFYLLVCPLLLTISVYKCVKGDKDSFNFAFLTILCLLPTIREFCIIKCYAPYFFILPLLLIFMFIFKLDVKEDYKKAFCCLLLLFSFFLMTTNVVIRTKDVGYIKSNKGTFTVLESKLKPFVNVMDYFKYNAKKNDRVLVLPEGPLLNFVLDIPTIDKYFQLSPDHIEAIGEDKIVSDLEKDMPEYIVVEKINEEIYGVGYFGEDFGLKILHFILKNYDFVLKTSTDKFYMYILKRKSKI